MFFKSSNYIEPKKWHYALVVIIVLSAMGFRIYSSLWPKATILVGGQLIDVLVADTQSHRFEGWSNKKNMGNYGGMLFVFPQAGQHTMVMRDMNFPLDILWINANKVVDIAPNLPPEREKKEEELTLYFSRAPSTMVLELPAGFAGRYKVKVGDVIVIN